ncbi:hypothetical protein EK21DRAFT_96983 [Setomelanomma holmii]|uniref:Uncharacterized protein n=1 Tax=Setomelanomma holmii TaxID=210430 RepID=A0A9P4LU06_9PLEO|nr:hypothetical protein EK21DRAFT_96983 [Setomelanomma holmii]
MGWWRRDPSLFSRSPIQRCAQRVLRDHEAALRTRCFSRTPEKSAQHQDDDRGRRPSNMTNLEWMQLQHYERWRKRLQEGPYKTLFGASNDMLSGKGLKDWEWIYKTFPKWMLKDMEMEEKPQDTKLNPSVQTTYPKKVEVADQNDESPQARAPNFPEPSFRRRRFERDESSGVVSPSDLRRPREGAHVKVVGKALSDPPTDVTTASTQASDSWTIFVPPVRSHTSTVETTEQVEETGVATRRSTRAEAAARESSFIEEFLSVEPEKAKSYTASGDTSSTWTQTALQRRASSGLIARPRTSSSLVTKDANAATTTTALDPTTESHQVVGMQNERSLTAKSKNVQWLLQQEASAAPNDGSPQSEPTAARSPSQILSQLPRDDIDFLSAADIRATMGAKRSRLPTDEQRQAERESLEMAFAAAQNVPHIDSMTETEVINNQHVRRTERQIRDSQTVQQLNDSQLSNVTTQQVSTAETPMESSIDRMKRWLETTGASFAKQFWQDPTEEADVTKTRLFFDKAAHYLKKGQAATRQITEDLEKDIPASKALLRRLKSDEEMVDLAIHRLRQRSSIGIAQGLSPRKIRQLESLKGRYLQTSQELEKAYNVLGELAGTDAVKNATPSFKRRLTVAARVLQKNSELLRMLIWSLQSRLEDSNMDRNILPNYKVLADNLLSLRDTQTTLMRLVERAMLVYGVTPQSGNGQNAEATKAANNAVDNCDEPFVRARLAADAHLINEIKAHKSVMQGLADDGSTRAPKSSKTSTLDEPSPLAHSLFRPFGPAINKLGSKNDPDIVAEKAKAEQERKLGDAKLVAEIRQAYEDTYGPITTEHTQSSPEPEANTGLEKGQATFAMLKEDAATGTARDATSEQTASNEATSVTSEVEVKTSITLHDTPGARLTDSVSAPEYVDTPEIRIEAPIGTPVTSSTTDLPTHYTILVRDPHTDILSITTSSTGPPRDTSPPLPLHQALSALDGPAKFIPYITSGLEVVTANKDILVLRDALESTASTRPFETVTVPNTEAPHTEARTVNPIDGTARLSPTGYIGPEESAEQLEKEFDERRQAAGRFNGKESEREEKPRKEKRRGAAGVLKTAIWVAGMCYVAGVIGEIAS